MKAHFVLAVLEHLKDSDFFTRCRHIFGGLLRVCGSCSVDVCQMKLIYTCSMFDWMALYTEFHYSAVDFLCVHSCLLHVKAASVYHPKVTSILLIIWAPPHFKVCVSLFQHCKKSLILWPHLFICKVENKISSFVLNCEWMYIEGVLLLLLILLLLSLLLFVCFLKVAFNKIVGLNGKNQTWHFSVLETCFENKFYLPLNESDYFCLLKHWTTINYCNRVHH